MKLTYLIFLLPAFNGCAGQQTQNEEKIGFRGLLIGSSPHPEMESLEKWRPSLGISSREISDAYKMPNESKILGDLAIKEVIYEYIDEKLFRVEVDLWTKNQMRCPKASELIAALESQFDISMKPYQIDYEKSQFLSQWRGSQAWITYICQPWNSTNSIISERITLKKDVENRLKIIKSTQENNTAEKMKRALQ